LTLFLDGTVLIKFHGEQCSGSEIFLTSMVIKMVALHESLDAGFMVDNAPISFEGMYSIIWVMFYQSFYLSHSLVILDLTNKGDTA